jgi:hypothetical protein
MHHFAGGSPERRRDVVLSEHSGDRAWEAVTTERYRYIRWGDGDEELYDLQEDPPPAGERPGARIGCGGN